MLQAFVALLAMLSFVASPVSWPASFGSHLNTNSGVGIVSNSSWTDGAGYVHIVGEVVNNTSQNQQFVEVDATYYDASSNVIGTDFTFTELDVLTPGEKSPFVFLVSPTSYPSYNHYTLGPVTGSATATAASQLFTTTVTSDTFDAYGYEYIAGTVLNRNTATADFVEPIFTFYNGGTVVDGDFTYVNTGSTASIPACTSAAFQLIEAPGTPAHTGLTVISQSSTAPAPDSSVPSAPTNVSATRGNASATISWSASTATACNPVTSYVVTASPGGQTATTTSTSTLVSGLTNGTPYTFTVRATSANGPGPASAPSNSVTPATTPGQPLNVTATAGDRSATITWSAPASNGGGAITAYTVTSSPGGLTSGVGGSTLSTQISGLTVGTVYTFTVVATNGVGPGSPSAASNSITGVSLPAAPAAPVATAAGGSAALSWTAPSTGGLTITGYVVTLYVSALPVATLTFTWPALTQAIPNLADGTTYTFTVAAVNALGQGPASPMSNSVVPDATLRAAVSQIPAAGVTGRTSNNPGPSPSPGPR